MAIRYHSRTDKIFDAANIAVLLGLAALTILPFLYVLAASFATESEIAARPFFLWPETATLDTYRYIFSTDTFIRSLDRKSTRLNSSHVAISYAVFCLKKKRIRLHSS